MTESEFLAVLNRPHIKKLNPHVSAKRKPCRPSEPTDKMTGLEKSFLTFWRMVGGDALDWLYAQKVFPERPKMHVDFKHVDLPVVVEIDGGQWLKRSGHNNGQGVQRDAEKLTLCNLHGLTLFRLTTDMVNYDEVAKIWSYVEARRATKSSIDAKT